MIAEFVYNVITSKSSGVREEDARGYNNYADVACANAIAVVSE